MSKAPVALIILDGFGFRDQNKKEMQYLKRKNLILIVIGTNFRINHLTACGEAVGLTRRSNGEF